MTPGTTTPAPEAQQHPAELEALVGLYRERQPGRVLEVGVGEGGTLWHWLQWAPAGTVVVALDDRHRNRSSYDDWTPADVELVAISGSSHDPDVLLDVAEHRPYDWILIDADHHDHAVRADWRHFSAMAAPGALVALHDVKASDDPTIHVDELWRELQLEHDTAEIVHEHGQGIGLVYLP